MSLLLAVLCVSCYLLAPGGWGLSPADPPGPELVTHLLVHRDWAHLGANLVTLVPFGLYFERRRSGQELLCLLLAAGPLSGWVECAADPTYPGQIVGASGAVAALLGAFGRLERWGGLVVAPVTLLFAWSALDSGGTHADWAHLAGFTVGLLWACCGRPHAELQPHNFGRCR